MAPPAHRGIFLAICSFLNSTGLVYMFLVGGYLPWNIAAATACLLDIVGFVLTFFCYDSPVWLIRKNKIEAARKSLQRIEGAENVNAKLEELRKITDNQPETKFSIGVFTEPAVWKPFMIILVMSVLQNTAGFYIILAYTVQFMEEFHSTYDSLQISVAVGVLRSIAMLLTLYLLRRMGRKHIGAISGFSSGAMLLLIYAYLRFKDSMPYLHKNSWIVIGLFLAYIVTMTLGVFPLPWTMPYEMFPMRLRGVMCGVSYCAMYLVMFFTVKAYNTMLDNLKLEGMILMFAVSSLLFGVFSITILVETRNKTLDEIEEVFAREKHNKKNEKG